MEGQRVVSTGILWAAAETWGQWSVGLAIFWIMAWLLGPQAWGLVGLATMGTVVAESLLTTGGWAEALVQREKVEQGHVTAVLWWLMALALGGMVVCAVAAPLMAWLWDQPSLVPLTLAVSLTLPLRAVSAVPIAMLRRELRFKPLALRSFLAVAGAGVLGVLAALAGWGVWSLVLYQVASAAIEAIVLWLTYPIPVARWPSWPHLRELDRYGYYSSADRVLIVLDTVVLRGLVGWIGGVEQVGGFVFARSLLALGAQLLLHPLTRVALPVFAQLQAEPLALAGALRRLSVASCAVALPAFAGLALVAPELVPLLFGASWAPTVPLLQLLAVAAAAMPVGNVDVALMRGTGRVGLQLVLSSISILLVVLLALPLAGLGAVGIGWACVLRGWLLLPVRHLAVSRALGLDRAGERSGLAVIHMATLAMILLALAWRWAVGPLLPPLPDLAATIGVAGLVYALATLMIDRAVVVDLWSWFARGEAP
jgi:PST family polysaccharide transporter